MEISLQTSLTFILRSTVGLSHILRIKSGDFTKEIETDSIFSSLRVPTLDKKSYG